MIIFSDIHLNENKLRTESILKNIKSIIEKHGDQDVVFNGDLIDYGERLPSSLVDYLIEVISLFKKKIFWISGQHDLYENNKSFFSNINLLKDNIKIITNKVFYYKNYALVPFKRNREDYEKMIKEINKDKIIITHIPVREAIITNEEKYVSCRIFDDFKLVIGGDIHNGKRYGKMQYVGCFAHSSFKDDECPNRYGFIKNNDILIYNINCFFYKIVKKEKEKITTPEKITNIKNQTKQNIEGDFASIFNVKKSKISITKISDLNKEPHKCLDKYCEENNIKNNEKKEMKKFIS